MGFTYDVKINSHEVLGYTYSCKLNFQAFLHLHYGIKLISTEMMAYHSDAKFRFADNDNSMHIKLQIV